jgi:hypothetical protein
MNLFCCCDGIILGNASTGGSEHKPFLRFGVAVKVGTESITGTVFCTKVLGYYYPSDAVENTLLKDGKGLFCKIKGDIMPKVYEGKPTFTMNACEIQVFPRRNAIVVKNENAPTTESPSPELW